MASRRISKAPSSFKNDSTESKSGSSANKATGAAKKTVKPSGTVVKSRYMQSAEKTSLSKSGSLTNDSTALMPKPSSPKPTGVRPKVGTPPRRSVVPQAFATSMLPHEMDHSVLGKSVLQSTLSDGDCFRPDFDISIIKENAAEPDRNPENDKRTIEMRTFLLAYLTAKMESNTAKLKAEAEMRILQHMEEEEALYNELQEKRLQYLPAEKNRLFHELQDLQIAALTPVVEAAKQFTSDYKSFATAVDATRHELPVKNFYIEGDRGEFLDKAEAYLKESERLLVECSDGQHKENSLSLECLKDIKKTSKDVSQQLSGAFSELLDLSSLVCRHTVQVQQAIEEEQLGSAKTHKLYCPEQ